MSIKPDLKPIPIPWSGRWRRVRFQLLPLVVFAAAVAGVTHLWQDDRGTAIAQGEVDSIFSEVASPETGSLAEILVERFGWVEEGEVVGRVLVSPPEVVTASLAVLMAEIELARLGWIDPVLDQQRNLLQRESLQHDYLAERTALALARVRLPQAERELERAARLFERNMIPENEYDRARVEVELLQAETENRRGLVETMEQSLQRLRPGSEAGDESADALRATLALQKERLTLLEAELRPLVLRSPIAGMVTDIHRQNGELIRAGEPVLTVRSPRAGSVTAYLRQPLRAEPEVGMAVEIVSRRGDGARVNARIAAVGPQMQELPTVLHRPWFRGMETGLPIRVDVTGELSLLPGEVVDVQLR